MRSPRKELSRVLILASNPQADLRLDKEAAEIRKALKRSDLEPQNFTAAQLEDLEDELLRLEPKFVHFCGHGNRNGHLIFQDQEQRPRPVSPRRLSALFGLFKANIECVFLNSCYSYPNAEAIAQHIPYAIGFKDQLEDVNAIEFSSRFYRALSARRSVPEAFAFACLPLVDTPSAAVPTLFERSKVKSQSQPPSILPFPPFANRQEAETLRNWMLDERCRVVFLSHPVLRGDRDIVNRTSLGSEIIRALDLRGQFEQVIQVRVGDHFHSAAVLTAILRAFPTGNAESSEDPSYLLQVVLTCLRSKRGLLLIEDLTEFSPYADLFELLATADHKSCLVVIGHGKPPEIAATERGTSTVHFLKLAVPQQRQDAPAELANSLRIETITLGAQSASRASLLRAEEKLRAGTARTIVPITRLDTQPDLAAFFRDPRPLLCVVGDSGSGKSTLFFQIYNSVPGDVIPIFYDVFHINEKRSFAKVLASDFLCDEVDLGSFLAKIDQALVVAGRHLLILVDGLNESRAPRPPALRTEIERVASSLPDSIKIGYSCRKIYWDYFIHAGVPLSRNLYFGSKEFLLGRFSIAESEEAFGRFKEVYNFVGDYTALSSEFKERIRDPLMMRMLAESYQGKELPVFAPAVLIFAAYEERFRSAYRGTVLPDFLDRLIDLKVRAAQTGRPSVEFLKSRVRANRDLQFLIQQQEGKQDHPGDPFVLLEDEGILSPTDERRGTFRFTFDRFFEYLLGKSLSPILHNATRGLFARQLRSEIQRLSQQHFSFQQALKSEVIRLNIERPDGPWSFYDPTVIRTLLDDPDAEVVGLTKDILRELTFEGREDLTRVIASVYPDESRNHFLMLDVAPDSMRVLPLVIIGLTSGIKEDVRRCCHLVASSLADPLKRSILEDTLFAGLQNAYNLEFHIVEGLMYYSAALFGAAYRLDRDAFTLVRSFWQRAWSSMCRHDSAMQTLIQAFVHFVRKEGGQFFGESSGSGMDYFWTALAPDLRSRALTMLPFLVDPALPLTSEVREIILFFGSSIKDWAARKSPPARGMGGYKLEYRIAQWIIVQRCRDYYRETYDLLCSFVDTGYSKSIDFALGCMELCCLFQLRDKAEIRSAFDAMLLWTALFKVDVENFYLGLTEPDPFLANQCPPDIAARVAILDEFSPREGPIPFLEEWLVSEDMRDVLMGLIAARNIWRGAPVKVLRTLDIVAHSDDPMFKAWLEKILKEMYLVHPRLVEDFFWRNSFDGPQIHAIKHRTDLLDPSAPEHPGHLLFIPLFLGPRGRREEFAYWYRRLHESRSLEAFCAELIPALIRSVAEADH